MVFSGPPTAVRACIETIKKTSDEVYDTHIVLATPGKVIPFFIIGVDEFCMET